jgi:hypothetical protein
MLSAQALTVTLLSHPSTMTDTSLSLTCTPLPHPKHPFLCSRVSPAFLRLPLSYHPRLQRASRTLRLSEHPHLLKCPRHPFSQATLHVAQLPRLDLPLGHRHTPMEFSLCCIHVTHATHKKEHLDPLAFFASWLGALGAKTTSISRLGIANTWHVTYIWRIFGIWEWME